MTLQELYDHLAPFFPLSVRKDVHTAVRVLAQTLNCRDPQHCARDQWHQPLPSLYRRVETYLSTQGKSSHTIRNTKNNLSRLWRLAEKQALFTPIPPVLTPRYTLETKPSRPGEAFWHIKSMRLPFRNWPPTLQESFGTFATWATASLVSGRAASLRKRPQTVAHYRHLFESYFGFLHHIQQLPTLTFDQLFDIDLVTAYVHWHVNELHKRPTTLIHLFLQNLLALTRQYRPDPELRGQFRALQKTLPTPQPFFNKDDAWVSTATLDEIGRTVWPRKLPQSFQGNGAKHPGLGSAINARSSVIFRLWFYIPLRQRNIREMKLEENLYKDANGHWRIRFQGEQLKIASRRGRPNIFDVPFPPTLVPILEDYLNLWRPILLRQASHPSPYVFLTKFGTPFTGETFRSTTKCIVYRYTGKHWHPHIVRTVWATEHIRDTGDFYGAAIMLNDTLETVMKTYAHLRDQNVAEEVYTRLDRRNGQGT